MEPNEPNQNNQKPNLNTPSPPSRPTTSISKPNQEVKEKPSIKIQIVGFLIIISSSVMIFAFLISMLMTFGDGAIGAFIPGLLALILGVLGLIVGSGIRSLKKWTWYVGTIMFGLVLIGNMISLVLNFEVFLILAILIEVFSIYALISEKSAFLSQNS